jgi:flagellar biosynthesis activator protein FlaF
VLRSDPAQSAYARQDAPAPTPRMIEYDALARVTRRLAAETPADQAAHAYPRLAAALHDNLRLWRALAEDVAHPDNGLPSGLRAQLFYLYEFTEVQSRRILDGTAKPQVLIEINTAVMRGLRGQRAAA